MSEMSRLGMKLREMRDLEWTMADMSSMVMVEMDHGGPPPLMSETFERGVELADALHAAGHGTGPTPSASDLRLWWQEAAFHAAGHYDAGTKRWETRIRVLGESGGEVLIEDRGEVPPEER
jgi:hypothetical protein